MEAPQLLRELGAVGITLTVLEPDRVIARPSERVTPEIKETLRENKLGIIRALRAVENPESRPPEPPPLTASPQDLAQAARTGLCAMWAREFSYVAIHDPTTGEWHDLPVKDAPAWAKNEAFKRKELWKAGTRRLLSREEMEEVWADEVAPMGQEADPAVTDSGILYRDYLDEEEVS